jgi:NADH-quinone oxidoreductase subunit I
MSCQICVEVCPFEAIKMDKDFELSRRERFDALLMRKDDLAKSNDYYHKIHPIEAAAVDKNLADALAAAEAKKKAAAEAAAKAAAAKEAPAKATQQPAPGQSEAAAEKAGSTSLPKPSGNASPSTTASS